MVADLYGRRKILARVTPAFYAKVYKLIYSVSNLAILNY
jgi:hypothetical protein